MKCELTYKNKKILGSSNNEGDWNCQGNWEEFTSVAFKSCWYHMSSLNWDFLKIWYFPAMTFLCQQKIRPWLMLFLMLIKTQQKKMQFHNLICLFIYCYKIVAKYVSQGQSCNVSSMWRKNCDFLLIILFLLNPNFLSSFKGGWTSTIVILIKIKSRNLFFTTNKCH